MEVKENEKCLFFFLFPARHSFHHLSLSLSLSLSSSMDGAGTMWASMASWFTPHHSLLLPQPHDHHHLPHL